MEVIGTLEFKDWGGVNTFDNIVYLVKCLSENLVQNFVQKFGKKKKKKDEADFFFIFTTINNKFRFAPSF